MLVKVIKQFLKFAIVGACGIVIDFGILNLLSWVFGITSGNWLIPMNIVAFGAALTTSFYFNKRWTFEDHTSHETGKKFNLFLLVSVLGVIINTAIVRVITDHVHSGFNLTPREWLNVAKGLATIVSGLWNFFNYKLNVFKK